MLSLMGVIEFKGPFQDYFSSETGQSVDDWCKNWRTPRKPTRTHVPRVPTETSGIDNLNLSS